MFLMQRLRLKALLRSAIESRGVQKTHRLAKPNPTQPNPPDWVGF